MDKNIHQSLIKNIEILRAFAARFSTDSVARQIIEVAGSLSSGIRFDILMSPYKQCFYLLGLLLSTPEPEIEREMKDAEWTQCVDLLQTIFQSYTYIFFPEDGDFESKSEEWHKHREVSMPAFLHHYNTSRTFTTPDQKSQTILGTLTPLDSELATLIGISASTALTITQWLSEKAQQELDGIVESMSAIKEVHAGFVTRVKDEGWGLESALEEGRNSPKMIRAGEILQQSHDPWIVRLGDLEARFGVNVAQAYWALLISRRGDIPSFTYPTEQNQAELKPMLLVSEGVAICPLMNIVFDGLYEQLVLTLTHDKQSRLARKFFQQRDNFLEQRVQKICSEFFGTDAQFYATAFETSLPYTFLQVSPAAPHL